MSVFYSFPKKYGKTFTITRRRPADAQFSVNTNLPVLNYADYCGDMVIRAYRDLIIDAGVTVIPENPCKGLYIYCDGDCTINGTLSMTARGAKFDPGGVAVGCRPKGEAFLNVSFTYPYTAEQLEDYIRRYIESIAENGIPTVVWPSQIINNIYTIPEGEADIGTVPAIGANGGSGRGDQGTGNAGSAGTGRKSGGGGGGGKQSSPGVSGSGGNGTAHSGGTGGGGASGSNNATNGSSIGGAGGNGNSSTCGGGAGNPSGSGGSGGADGNGGLIILVVKGNLNIGANGKIESKGSVGKSGGAQGGGGGSGGGSINIFYGGSYTKTGSVLATGGAGGTASYTGGAGGAGCITETQI